MKHCSAKISVFKTRQEEGYEWSSSSLHRPLSETDLTSTAADTDLYQNLLSNHQHLNHHQQQRDNSQEDTCIYTQIRDHSSNYINLPLQQELSGVPGSEGVDQGGEEQLPGVEELERLEEMSQQEQLQRQLKQADPLAHLVAVLQYHPQYLAYFMDTHRFLLYGNGPLPYDHRHYIAIMAAAQCKCWYLVHAESTIFLSQGGERAWLKGLRHAPRKLRHLALINRLLAHRPWLLKPEHITALVKDTRDKWSLPELTHALVLLSHFHALSGFCHGCGITDAEVSDGVTRARSLSNSSSNPSTSRERAAASHGDAGDLIERMRALGLETRVGEDGDVITPEEINQRYDNLQNLAMQADSTARQQRLLRKELSRYVDDAEFSYEDFSIARAMSGRACKQSRDRVQTYVAQDFLWEDQGYSLSCRLYMEIGSILDTKFNIAQQLTYYTCGSKHDIDTSLFREAVWKFVHCLYGIRHNYYDYSTVSRLLDEHLRSYVKLVSCYPENVTRSDYNKVTRDLQHSEKVHINIMIMESRIQSELMYGLRAISRHLT